MTQSFSDPGMAGGGDSTRTANVVLDANVSGYTQQMAAAAQQTGALGHSVDALQAKLEGLNKWAGRKLFQFAAADFAVLTGAAADAATFQKQLSTLAATTAITNTSMHGLKGGIENAFTSLPVSRTQVIALVEAITNLGVTSNTSIASLTQTFIKLGAATGEPMNQLASGLIQLSRLMGSTDATQIGNFANSLLTVSKNAGVSASGVLAFAQAIAPMARQAGISEGAVLGISTAFNKAGADGYVAANTFNSILSDISSSIASGSPELSKYANLIGVTAAQFKSMDKQTAIVEIFNKISSLGPKAINILNSLGIEGTRAQSAIAAVTQSGGLQQAIAQATGAASNQGNLNVGSHAAFNNFADSLVRVRNEFTQIGTEIGTTFLGPMTAVVSVIDHLAKSMNNLIRPLAPVISGLAAITGGAAAAGGVALSAAGAIGAYALVRNVRQSQVVRSLRQGVVDRRGFMGTGEPVVSERGLRYASGEMRGLERMGYRVGAGAIGPLLGGTTPGGPSSPWRSASTWRNAAIAGPAWAASGFSRANENFMNSSLGIQRAAAGDLPGYRERLSIWGRSLQGRPMLDVAGESARGLAGQLGSTAAATTRVGAVLGGRVARSAWAFAGPSVMGALVGGATGVPGMGRAVNQARGALPTGSIATEYARAQEAAMRFGTALRGVTPGVTGMRGVFGEVAASGNDLARSFLRLTGTVAGAGVGQAVRGTAGTAAKLGSGLASVAGMAGRAVFSLPGIVGLEAGTYAYGKMKANQADHLDVTGKYLNPIQMYNNQLGIATAKLATFSNNVEGSGGALTKALNGVTSTSSLTGTANVTKSDVLNAVGGKSNDKALNALASTGTGAGSEQSLSQLASSYDMTDARQVQLFKQNALSLGFSPETVQGALTTAARTASGGATGAQPAQDFSALAVKVSNTEGRGGGGTASKSGQKLRDSVYTSLDTQSTADAQFGAAYSSQRKLAGQVDYLAAYLKTIDPKSQAKGAKGAEVSQAFTEFFGGNKDKYYNDLLGATGKYGHQDLSKMSTADLQKLVLGEIGSQTPGRNQLNTLGAQGVDVTNPASWAAKLKSLYGQGIDNETTKNIQRLGPVGVMAEDPNSIVQKAALAPDDVGLQHKGMLALADGWTKATGSIAGATEKLGEMQGAINDVNDPLYKMAAAAKAEIATRQQFAAPYQSRATKLTQSLADYQGAAQASALQPNNADLQGEMEQKRTQYEAAKAEQTQYLQSMMVQFKQYNTQMERASYDEGVQVARANAAFKLQMKQSDEDYLKQRGRTQHDYDVQLANQAAQAAQSIYNPYQRVQAQYTLDAASLLSNLKDQNQRIIDQQKQLAEVAKAGVSTQAIQTLDLANPNNSQQLSNLVSSLANDPTLVAQINAEAAKRLKGTAGLTQSTYNLQFVQGQAQFQTQLERTAADYKVAMDRAHAAQKLAMSNMATDFNLMVSRSADDLNTATKEIFGTFGQSYSGVMKLVTGQLAKFAPQAAQTMLTQLAAIKKAYPMLLDDNYVPKTKTSPAVVISVAHGSGAHAGGATSIAQADGGIWGARPGGHQLTVAEAGASEAVIPLNDRGQHFMSGMIAKSLAQMTTPASYAPAPSVTTVDSSTNFTGAVTVVAQDTKVFEREMKAKARLKKLSSPVRH